jgi:hypothetical protein
LATALTGERARIQTHDESIGVAREIADELKKRGLIQGYTVEPQWEEGWIELYFNPPKIPGDPYPLLAEQEKIIYEPVKQIEVVFRADSSGKVVDAMRVVLDKGLREARKVATVEVRQIQSARPV